MIILVENGEILQDNKGRWQTLLLTISQMYLLSSLLFQKLLKISETQKISKSQ